MTTVPDIPELHIQAVDGVSPVEPSSFMPTHVSWAAAEVPRGRRISPTALAGIGVLAGIGAMALGAAAVIAAGTSRDTTPSNAAAAVAIARAAPSTPGIERRVLALLAKPSTERVMFKGSGGRLVLVVGTGGRAAILIRGLERAAPGKPYRAWILVPGDASVRAAQFVGTERAVFLSVPVGREASVVVSTERPVAGRPAQLRVVAQRR